MNVNDWRPWALLAALIILVVILSKKAVVAVSEIARVASNAGFRGQDLIIAVAIAYAESSGDPKAHGDTELGSGRGSFGLWQIYSDAHPEFGPDFERLYDPQINANAAYRVYLAAGRSFKPWSTFKNGAYLAFLDSAKTGVQV